MVATFDDIEARDEESGLLHLAHAATNIAFILQPSWRERNATI